MSNQDFDQRPLFLGRKADLLSTLIETQTAEILESYAISIPVRSCSLISALADLESASAADIAKHLGQSHQLVLQKIPALLKLKLIVRKADSSDKRRKIFSLTNKGCEQLEQLNAQSHQLEAAYEAINAELGVNVFEAISAMHSALERRPLADRLEVT